MGINTVSRKQVRRLNGRQRKKLRLAEFQELLFEVSIQFRTPLDADGYYQIWDALIAVIDKRGLSAAGLGGTFPLSATDGVIFAALRGSPTEEDRQAVLTWLEARPEVAAAKVGEFKDAWYGDESL